MRISTRLLGSLFLWLGFLISSSALGAYTLSGELTGCAENTLIHLYRLDGILYTNVRSVNVRPNNEVFSFVIPTQEIEQGLYYIGTKPDKAKLIYIAHEQDIKIISSCEDFRDATWVNSPANEQLLQLEALLNRRVQLSNEYGFRYMTSLDPTEKAQYKLKLGALDAQKISTLDSLKQVNPFMAHYAALRTQLSYANHQKENEKEIDYLLRTYFEKADLGNPAYHRIPTVAEAFHTYARIVSQGNYELDEERTRLDANLSRMSPYSPSYKTAMVATIYGLSNSDNFIHYGQKYLEQYPNEDVTIRQYIQNEIKNKKPFMVGAIAPDFALPTPDGQEITLSSLRGQYVMIDFWASWCGPCRKENPEVVRLYHQYQSKGFQILGVSLDRDRQAWTNAIAKDGLEWLHVSDLQYWQCAPAKLYKVTGIPQNFLLDKEGRIIAKGLHGEHLAQKLAKLFP